ncbi:Caveolin-1 [Caenorhabditis elegans]|uniref:Caveolin-1 n=2 Tax=Caenorhabditis elegans TaxID=6239 RepID=CAV1_CAEEL|nr:Caveolin-1 [Caenorhabditis elegans]Q94051.1 RecName: Full=Caveolin-1 [Caenorhabditis elegans]AAB48388.1 caveolin-1 [Caenorhabditis elegans]CAB03359.1 Caveolin-1 [Caenorhabditis elegans]|eukprot:NP_001255421.1 Caveolin-1 [Caenorhabditis elegans]
MSTEQDIKTEEQIPLTYAAVAAPTVQTEGEAVVAPEEPKPKKNWFTFGKKKAAPTDETNIEEGGAPGDEPVKEKKEKKCWWSRCQKGEGEQKEENIAIGVDLVNRDANSMNNHVQLNFEDIFGEADSQHSWDCVWRLNHTVFTAVRLFIYRLVSLLALPFTIIFAIFFGLLASINVFIIVPLGKLLSIPGTLLAKLWNWLIHAIFDPIASAVGLIFSNFNIRKYGINQETTAPCV